MGGRRQEILLGFSDSIRLLGIEVRPCSWSQGRPTLVSGFEEAWDVVFSGMTLEGEDRSPLSQLKR